MMNVNFISFKNSGDKHSLNLVSDNIKTMIGYNTSIIVNDLFRTFFTRYQQSLEAS